MHFHVGTFQHFDIDIYIREFQDGVCDKKAIEQEQQSSRCCDGCHLQYKHYLFFTSLWVKRQRAFANTVVLQLERLD